MFDANMRPAKPGFQCWICERPNLQQGTIVDLQIPVGDDVGTFPIPICIGCQAVMFGIANGIGIPETRDAFEWLRSRGILSEVGYECVPGSPAHPIPTVRAIWVLQGKAIGSTARDSIGGALRELVQMLQRMGI